MNGFTVKKAAAIAGLVMIWGASWSIYKVTLAYTPPILFAGMRSLFGGVLLALFLLPQLKKLKWRQNWLSYTISGLFNAVLFYGTQTVGLTYLPGGLFSVLVYFQPVLLGLFAWLWLGERMSLQKLAGLLIGFCGIVAISSDSITGNLSLVGVALAIVSAISWALGVVYVKKVSYKVDALWMVAMQFVIGGAILTGIGAVNEEITAIVWNSTYVMGLGFGATLGVPIAFVLYYKLINSGDASKVAAFTFLVPLIAVFIGTAFMEEPFTYSLIIGLFMIIASITIVNYPMKKRAVKTSEMTAGLMK